eukprot:CAMPEP_0115455004 /NCGR_PEP_ID=MMETSP0271-20121206/43934_1 /TAXON_ID=71861 /ORGANISM="Scrippsiella trochoidea, Strain CCMP3099" /LENGTH=87 /DNA_ID=CAMNT_0002881445 /DNA_START=349 /DNA_END=609 /DNA_ORIENTATION=+
MTVRSSNSSAHETEQFASSSSTSSSTTPTSFSPFSFSSSSSSSSLRDEATSLRARSSETTAAEVCCDTDAAVMALTSGVAQALLGTC